MSLVKIGAGRTLLLLMVQIKYNSSVYGETTWHLAIGTFW